MDISKLNDVLAKEPAFRLAQCKKAIFQDLIEDWQEAKTLPLDLREKLNKKCLLKINFEASVSEDENTIKALITLKDNYKIEAVLMKHDGRNTVCVSSQVGCPLFCSFCATGRLGFKRELKDLEIVEQVLLFARYLKMTDEKITNIVFMGMGEPFLNYENVLSTIRILNDKNGFNLGARHFSISTAGIPAGINKLADEKLQVNLAISLHAPNDELRSKLMPINRKYFIKEILKNVDEYILKTNRRVMFEYIMIRNVNDSEKEAKELADLMRGRPLCFVNLISYNPTGVFKPSLPEKIKKFKQILEEKGITVTQRYKFGKGIKAACGQLVGKKNG